MDRTSRLGKPISQPHPGTDVDDLWMEDFKNDLGCLSLSSDDEVPAHFDELGQMGRPDQGKASEDAESKHRHGTVGI
jgi:hypothetical protein